MSLEPAVLWLGSLVFLGLWFVQTILDVTTLNGFANVDGRRRSSNGQNRQWYDSTRRRIVGAPPAWLFGVVWAILYTLNALAGFYYWKRTKPMMQYYDAALTLYLINWLLQKIWTPIFFGWRRVALALVVLLLCLVTAVVVLVLFALDAAWISFGLYLPYVLWLCYAAYLNAAWLTCGTAAATSSSSDSRASVSRQRQKEQEREEESISSRPRSLPNRLSFDL